MHPERTAKPLLADETNDKKTRPLNRMFSGTATSYAYFVRKWHASLQAELWILLAVLVALLLVPGQGKL